MLNYSQTIVSPLPISRAVLARANGGHADVRPGVRRFLGSKHVPRCYSIQEGPVFIETQVRGKALSTCFPGIEPVSVSYCAAVGLPFVVMQPFRKRLPRR